MRDLQNSILATQQQQGHLTEQQQEQLQHQQGTQQLNSSPQQTWNAVQLPGSPSDAVILVDSPQRPKFDASGSKQPLLQQSSPRKAAAAGSTPSQPWCAGVRELRVLLRLAVPTIITTAAQQVIIVTSQMFSGHIGTDEMAAAALSNTWWNLMWYILLGVSTALDTLGSQAVGAGDKEGLIMWSITAAVILTLINIPMAAGMWYGDWVAQHLFRQGPEVVELVKRFCRWLLPGLWPMTMAQLLQKYLQTQGLVNAPAVVSGLSIIFNIAATWAGTDTLGLKGVAIAATATRVLLLVMMVVAVAVKECRATRGCGAWWQTDSWQSAATRARAAVRSEVLWTYLALGIPGGVMLGLECASFEVTTAFAGLLGPAEVAAHAGVFAITSLCYISLPFALATAATIRVGNLVGAGRGDRAAVASRVVVGLGSTFMAICGLAIYFGRYQLGELFTAGDPEVLRAVAMIAPLGAAYQVFDGVLGTSQGVLRGLGRQAQLMILNMVAFWLIGVPTGYALTFKAGWGLRGLWVGMSIGGFLAASVSLCIMLLVNWAKEVELARERQAVQSETSSRNSSRRNSIGGDEIESSSLAEPLLQDEKDAAVPV